LFGFASVLCGERVVACDVGAVMIRVLRSAALQLAEVFFLSKFSSPLFWGGSYP